MIMKKTNFNLPLGFLDFEFSHSLDPYRNQQAYNFQNLLSADCVEKHPF